jgi:hypothetical protein
MKKYRITHKYFWQIIILSNSKFKKILKSLTKNHLKKLESIYLKYYSTLSEKIITFNNYEHELSYLTNSVADHFSRFVIDKYGKLFYYKIIKNPNIIFKHKKKFINYNKDNNTYDLKLGNKQYYPKLFLFMD